ncbi:MAG: hypothetical protein WCI97_10635, partial [Bacteroidota bacterium]
MEKTEFYKLIENPSLLKELSKGNLDDLIQRYPWFASAHLLKAKLSQLQNHPEGESILSFAAVYANNRVALFELMYPSAPERIFRIETENIESLSNGNGKADSITVTEPITEKEILTIEELQEVESLISNSEKVSEQNSGEISEEINVVSIVESGLQITEFPDEELIQAGDHEEEGILAVENAVLKEQEENLSEEFEALSQSGSSAEFVPMEIDEELDEPEIDKNEVELSSTRFLDEEIENSEVDEMLKDAEVEMLSASEYSHKNEEDETDEEGIAEEDFETELESLKNIEAQNAIEISASPVYASEKITSSSNEEHSFLDWLKKLSPEKSKEETFRASVPKEKISEIKTQSVTEIEIKETDSIDISSEQEAIEESLIEFTPDLLLVSSEEDLKVIDNFVQSIKEKKAEPPQDSFAERAEKSLLSTDEFATETLAKILSSQGKYQRAISMYEKLSLKFPDKSHYFAPLI